IAWQEHPDYRADQAYNEVLRLPLLGAGHETRAAIALALFYRYTGKDNPKRTSVAAALVSPETVLRMKVLGQAARLGLTLSGGQPHLLKAFALRLDETYLTLEAPAKQGEMVGEVVTRRLSTLAQVVGRSPRVSIRQ
ncbi:MAG: exopolyphosphatase, partial [Rhodospirillaceae bacterium]|nr:exopolyphosphatase [Rhodospirillaceae bacterium]